MTTLSTRPEPGPGHNVPDFAGEETSRLAMDYSGTTKSVDDIEARAAALPAEVTDDAGLDSVTAFVNDARDLWQRVEAMRVPEKEPHLRRGNAVDQFFGNLKTRIGAKGAEVGERGNVYNKKKLAAERARLEAERREAERVEQAARAKADEEARLAREAEEVAERARKPERIAELEQRADAHGAAAAGAAEEAKAASADTQAATAAALAKPAEIVRRRTTTGHMSTMRQVPRVEILDASKLDREKLWPFIKEDALLAALKSWAKVTNHKQPMAGAIVEMVDDTVYR